MRKFRRHCRTAELIGVFSLLLIVGCTRATSAYRVSPSPAADGMRAAIVLPVPTDPAQRTYLGLEATHTFTLSDIQTDVLIIEVFDFYCPHCQREAPNVNRLYRRISRDPDLRERIKLIGIGVSNTSFEVNQFRQSFDIPFPLFPDRSREIARDLDVRQTPTFIGFVWGTGGKPERFLYLQGGMGDVDTFLSKVIRLSAIAYRQD
jgi:peroxiredoxin